MTDCPDLIADVRLSSMIEPDVDALEMEAADPSMVTMKSDVSAVVADRVSS